MTEYRSTRGGVESVPYDQVVIDGLAPNRGLYVPESYPQIGESALRELVDAPTATIFTRVKTMLAGGSIPTETLERIGQESYGPTNFPHAEQGVVTPLKELGDGMYLLGLSDGPTAAFKDQALQPLARELNYILERRDAQLAMLGATSGDTGSAAEAAFKGYERMWLGMLSPKNGMTPFQSAQMAELSGGNILNMSLSGKFDDCHRIVKDLKDKSEFKGLGAVNSINWGRISAQVPYWISGYLQASQGEVGKPVDFVVPSGNFGNALAGYVAREMGVPIRRIIIATNENSVLDELVQTGVYRYRKARDTSSPSMDISESSNWERAAFDILGQDPDRLKSYIGQFTTTGTVSFADFGLPAQYLKDAMDFDSSVSTHDDRIATIRQIYEDSDKQIVIDPHTADAVFAAFRKRERGVPIVTLETALPAKFDATIQEALGIPAPRIDQRFVGLEERAGKSEGFEQVDTVEDVTTILHDRLARAAMTKVAAGL